MSFFFGNLLTRCRVMRPTVWKTFGRNPRYTALKEAFGFYVLPRSLFRIKAWSRIELAFGTTYRAVANIRIRFFKAKEILRSPDRKLWKNMCGKWCLEIKKKWQYSYIPKYLNNVILKERKKAKTNNQKMLIK